MLFQLNPLIHPVKILWFDYNPMKFCSYNLTSKSWLIHTSMISRQWNWILSCDIIKQLYIYPWNKVLQDENQKHLFIKLERSFVYCLKCMKVNWRERSPIDDWCSVLEHLKTKSAVKYCCSILPPYTAALFGLMWMYYDEKKWAGWHTY